MPAPLQAHHWQRAGLITLDRLVLDADWKPIDRDDIHIKAQRDPALVPPTCVSFKPGAAIEFRFKGRMLGLVGLKGAENGKFRITVDEMPPQVGTLFDHYSLPGRYPLSRWMYPNELPDTEHRVRLELLPDKIDKVAIMAKYGNPVKDRAPYAPHGLYLSGFLIVGELVGESSALPAK